MRLIPSIGIILFASGIYSFYELAKFVENSVKKTSRERYDVESALTADTIIKNTVIELSNNFNEKFIIDTLSLYPLESVEDYNLLFSNVIGKRGLTRLIISERIDNKTEEDDLVEKLGSLYNFNVSISTVTSFVDNSTLKWISVFGYPPRINDDGSPGGVGRIINSEPLRSSLYSEMFATGEAVISTDIKVLAQNIGFVTATPISFVDNLVKTAIGQLFDYNKYFGEYVTPFQQKYVRSEIQIILGGNVVFNTFDIENPNENFQEFNHEKISIKISNFDDYLETTKTFEYVFIPCVIGTILLYFLLVEMDRRRILAIKHSNYSTRFIADFSHEIRTPLNGIQGVSEIMSDNDISETDSKYLRIIKSCVNSVMYLVNNVIESSTMDQGNFKITFKKENMFEILIKCLNDSWATYGNEDVDLMITVGSIPRECICDGKRIMHIISNILSNAFRFTESGRVTVNINGNFQNNTFVIKCEVKDTGKGMEEKIKKQLFTPFLKFNAENSGTGIGLYLSKKIAKLMRGDVYCSSTEIGIGSIFIFTFTVDSTDNKYMEPFYSTLYKNKKEVCISKSNSEISTNKVLIVDDVSVNRMILGNIMNSIGVDFDYSENGLESVKLCQSVKYKAIFMDNMMPIMGGEEATRKIRKTSLNENTPIIFVSANSQPIVIERCMESGGNSFLEKPVTRASIIRALD